MRRADLLSLTGISVGLFNNLSQRRLLPFPPPASDGWATFEAGHALRLALLLELARAGRAQEQAASLIRAEYNALLDFVASAPDGAVTLFGSFSVVREDEEAASHLHAPIMCSLGEGGLDGAIAATLHRIEADHSQVGEIVVVNASRVVKRLLDRASGSKALDAEFANIAQTFKLQHHNSLSATATADFPSHDLEG